jgi:hypothetical protein
VNIAVQTVAIIKPLEDRNSSCHGRRGDFRSIASTSFIIFRVQGRMLLLAELKARFLIQEEIEILSVEQYVPDRVTRWQ